MQKSSDNAFAAVINRVCPIVVFSLLNVKFPTQATSSVSGLWLITVNLKKKYSSQGYKDKRYEEIAVMDGSKVPCSSITKKESINNVISVEGLNLWSLMCSTKHIVFNTFIVLFTN